MQTSRRHYIRLYRARQRAPKRSQQLRPLNEDLLQKIRRPVSRVMTSDVTNSALPSRLPHMIIISSHTLSVQQNKPLLELACLAGKDYWHEREQIIRMWPLWPGIIELSHDMVLQRRDVEVSGQFPEPDIHLMANPIIIVEVAEPNTWRPIWFVQCLIANPIFNLPHHLWLRHIFMGILVVIVKVTELSYSVSMAVSGIEALLEQPACGAKLRFVEEIDCGIGLGANVDFYVTESIVLAIVTRIRGTAPAAWYGHDIVVVVWLSTAVCGAESGDAEHGTGVREVYRSRSIILGRRAGK